MYWPATVGLTFTSSTQVSMPIGRILLLTTPDFYFRSVRRGTSNFFREPAMNQIECEQALEIGREQVRDALNEGLICLASERWASATRRPPRPCSSRCAVSSRTKPSDGVQASMTDRFNARSKWWLPPLERYSPLCCEPAGLYWLRVVGGFEIAAMAGTLLEAAKARLPVVVDGFIATAAAAAAFSIDQSSREICFFSHRSGEQAHGKALEALKVEPLLDLKMRLGEGTGAALAMPILEAAAKIFCEMATFESAGVSAGHWRRELLTPMNGQSFMTTIRQQFNIFLGALMFLTRLPVGKGYVFRSEDLPRSAVYFPIVGLIDWLTGRAGAFLRRAILSRRSVAVLFCMGTSVVVTGALHEDGLADAMDGLLGGHEPQRRLEIMRDSRLGSFGAVALWFSLTAKAFVLTSLSGGGSFEGSQCADRRPRIEPSGNGGPSF